VADVQHSFTPGANTDVRNTMIVSTYRGENSFEGFLR